MEIDRRTLMGWMGFTGGSAMGAPWLRNKIFGAGTDPMIDLPEPQTTPTRWETSAAKKREQTRDVTWLTHEPLNFLLRRGDHFDDEPEHYQRMIEPENIRRKSHRAFLRHIAQTIRRPVKTVLSVSPERDDVASLTFEEAGNTVKFTAPAMKVYSLIVVAQ
jgi:hypothetical protein